MGRVGFIGLGKMGRPMAERLLAAGFDLTVHNRSRGPVEALVGQGARPADAPVEVGRACEVVLTCLPDAAAVEAVYLGAGGLVESARAGQVLVDHSTVSPDLARTLARAFAARGVAVLDAPVSGGVEGAMAGTLTIMVGGDAAAFARVQPVFAAYGRNIRHVGPSGSGAVVKLANQLLTAVNTAAIAEAFVLGVRAGADPAVMFEVIRTGYGASAMLERNVPRFLARDFVPGGTISTLLKDLGFVHELARTYALRLLLASTVESLLLEARASGLGDEDMAALVKVLEQLAGCEVRHAG